MDDEPLNYSVGDLLMTHQDQLASEDESFFMTFTLFREKLCDHILYHEYYNRLNLRPAVICAPLLHLMVYHDSGDDLKSALETEAKYAKEHLHTKHSQGREKIRQHEKIRSSFLRVVPCCGMRRLLFLRNIHLTD